MGQGGRIVVGVDGSPASNAALAWALDEARRREATLHLVHALHFPPVALSSYGNVALPVLAPEDLAKVGEQVMSDAMAAVGSADDVEMTTSVERGHPAEALLAAAAGADLLVVGSRGLGGFGGMLLGSVSNNVMHHATCPVVVVRADDR